MNANINPNRSFLLHTLQPATKFCIQMKCKGVVCNFGMCAKILCLVSFKLFFLRVTKSRIISNELKNQECYEVLSLTGS